MKHFSLVLFLCSGVAFAQDTATTTTATTDAITPSDAVVGHKNIFSAGVRLGEYGAGFGASYNRVLAGRLALGTSLTSFERSSQADYEIAPDSNREFKAKSTLFDVSLNVYFRRDGYGKWGPYVKTGVGHGRHELNTDSMYAIYESKRVFSSTFAHLGAHYQFVWGFSSTGLGHVLDIGLAGYLSDRPVASLQDPILENDLNHASVFGVAEVSYSLAF